MIKLNFREKYAAFVLLSIGIIYLLLYIVSFFQNESSVFSSSENQVSVNTQGLIDNSRIWLTIIFPIIGSILLFKKKKIGWILSVAIYPIFLIMLGGGLFTTISMDMTTELSFNILLAGGLILILAFLFLLIPSCIKKFKIRFVDGIIAIILAAFNCFVFFLL